MLAAASTEFSDSFGYTSNFIIVQLLKVTIPPTAPQSAPILAVRFYLPFFPERSTTTTAARS